jgi:predicted flap endonuclease-1-like 5' DNA nuclease
MGILACYSIPFVVGLIVGTVLSWLLHRLWSHYGSTGGNDQRPRPVTPTPSGSTTQSPPQYSPKSHDDQLEAIEGIGVEIAKFLRSCNIRTFADLANKSADDLRALLDKAGDRFALARTDTWPRQAKLLADGKILEFMELTRGLIGGVDPSKK